ncbi:MAG: glycerate kinase [Rhodospirillaceae bacterium]|nr:glycerate kinase [Rhodospirillaceae bacterium]MYH38351.1 glycerate kinase [Rhodospirillaceae bacterium]MYK13724.1 glycerate kinase [Rhodospirillaceae bacterium]MYK59868.1 glycerate kinase [Rhodospirillaceae bacterium]
MIAPVSDPPALLRRLLDEAVAVARPERCLPPVLAELERSRGFGPAGRMLVLGAGKAAAAMAQTVERAWPERDLEGLVVTRYGHAVPCRRIRVLEAAHPVPDRAGAEAAAQIVELARNAGAEDAVLFLLSGGASALLNLPAPGLTLTGKQAVTRALLAAGADIHELNAVRKHLSAIKGGRLAAGAAPARLTTLAISDVAGDDPATIGSGPTVADPTTLADARRVLEHYDIAPGPEVTAALDDPANETVKPGDPRLAGAHYRLIATPAQSLAAAARLAKAEGFAVEMLGDSLTGEARDLGRDHAALARERAAKRQGERPLLLLSGGETTVTLVGRGRGGPNTEYLLALAEALDGRPGVWALAADTDGADGSEDNAGAIVGPDTPDRAGRRGLRPAAFLTDNDAWSFFDALDDLVVTGPTHTNVNDFRAILIA